MSLVLPEVTVTLPRPLSAQDLAEGRTPPYEPREVSIRTMPAAEALQWVFDVGEASGAGEALLGVVAGGEPGPLIAAVLRIGGARTQTLLDRLLKYTRVTYQRRVIELRSRDAFDEAFSGELRVLLDVVIETGKQVFEPFSRGQPPARFAAAV